MLNKRILIAEDEWVVAHELQHTLTASGYNVIGTVGSGEEAVTVGAESKPDLVIMDIVLGGKLDGISAAQRLQPLGIPVVYLTSYSDRHLLDRAQHTEPLAYVIKPAKTGELAAVIKLALFKRDQEQQRDRDGQQRRATATREAEEQFRLMVAGVTEVAVFTMDAAGLVNSWNRGAEKVTGYSSDQILGQPFALLFTPEDRAHAIPEAELATAERHGSASDTRWLSRADGVRYWAEGVLTAIHDEAGALAGFSKTVKDATRYKRAQQTLGNTEEKLRVALQAARMGTWEWEIQPNRDHIDDNLRALFGLAADQQVTTIEDFYALVHPDDRPGVIAAFERTRREGVHLDTEFRIPQPDGTVRWLLDQGDVILDEHGQPERMTGVCVDITERRRAQHALRESEERFRLFVNGVRDYALLQMDGNGRIVSWNPGAERLLGYSEAEIVGQPSSILFVPEDIANELPRKELEKARISGRAEDERWHVRKDGSRFWCSGSTSRLDQPGGSLRGFAKVMRDETERKQAREQLQASLTEKEALLKEIHHRVKNNLQVITSLLNLQAVAVEDAAIRQLFEESVNRVRTIGDIHELLYRSPDLARIDFNLYLIRLAETLLSFYGVDDKRIRVRIDAKDAVLAPSQAIPCGLIVNELLTNSLKHAFLDGRSGEIHVSLRCAGERCILTVSDTGVGLPQGLTIDDTTSLGLRLVSALAHQLQGEVRLDATGGASYVIAFPAAVTEHAAGGQGDQQ